MACRFPHPYGRKKENSEPSNPESLMKLALKAVPQPRETARALLPPWHKRERDRQEHEKKIQVCHERIKVCG